MLSNTEKGYFLKLFNRSGHVLDFSIAGLDAFTLDSVGVAVCSKYGLPKMQSLNAFVGEASGTKGAKVLLDLLEYYEAVFAGEYDKDQQHTYGMKPYDAQMAYLYKKCRSVADREQSRGSYRDLTMEYIDEEFSSDYLSGRITLLVQMRD